jgi:hypothetical protein
MPALDEEELRSLTELLLDASSSGGPTVTPASAGLLDAKSGGSAGDGGGRVGRGISPSERLAVHVLGGAVRSTVPRSTVPRQGED